MPAFRQRPSKATLPIRFARLALERLEDRLPPGDIFSLFAGTPDASELPLLSAPTTATTAIELPSLVLDSGRFDPAIAVAPPTPVAPEPAPATTPPPTPVGSDPFATFSVLTSYFPATTPTGTGGAAPEAIVTPPAPNGGAVPAPGPVFVAPVEPGGGGAVVNPAPGGGTSLPPSGGTTSGGTSTSGSGSSTTGAGIQPQSVAISSIGDDTGESDSDGITSDNTLTVNGTGTAGVTVEVLVDEQVRATAVVTSSGTWTATLPVIADGSHQIQAAIKDSTETSEVRSVIIDTVAPNPEFVGQSHFVTHTPVVTLDVQGGESIPTKIDIDWNHDGDFNDENEDTVTTVFSDLGQVFVPLVDIPSGNWDLRARTLDLAGNEGISDTWRLWIAFDFDHLAPGHDDDHGMPGGGGEAPGGGGAPPTNGGVGGGGGGSGIILQLVDTSETESNDSQASANTVTLPAGDTLAIAGSITPGSDQDWFSFTLTTRTGMFFDIDSRETGLSTTLNTILTLFDNAGTQLSANDNGYDFDTGLPAQFAEASASTADSAIYRDLDAGTYAIRVTSAGGTTGDYSLRIRGDTNYASAPPTFQSLPSATDVLFLDFDGHAATDDWGTYTIQPFDFNGNTSEYSPGEQLAIQNIWRTVAEDFSPFNLNVVTSFSGTIADGAAFRMVLGGGNGSEIGQSGILGVAFLDSYAAGGVGDSVAFSLFDEHDDYMNGDGGLSGTIMAQAQDTGGTVSHEFGHALGLNHFDNGSPPENAPTDISLMFNGSLGLGRYIWRNSTNVNNQPQDDMAIIANTTNTFGYRPDDHANATTGATVLTATGTVYSGGGVIAEVATDIDVFQFEATSGGPTTISVQVDEFLNDLDVRITLLDSSGNVVASDNPGTSFDASLTQTLADGTYFLQVESTGVPGSAGQYTFTISVPTPPGGGPGGGGPGGGGGGSTTSNGDIFEPNDTSEVASNLGTIISANLSNLTIANKPGGLSDYDWFRFTPQQSGSYSFVLQTVGAGGPLEMHLFVENDGFLTEIAAGPNLSAAFAAGQSVYIEIKGVSTGVGTMTTGTYNLTFGKN